MGMGSWVRIISFSENESRTPDNATRVAETGHRLSLHRYDWSDEDLLAAVDRLIRDPAAQDRLARTNRQMREVDGPSFAAQLLEGVLQRSARVARQQHCRRVVPHQHPNRRKPAYQQVEGSKADRQKRNLPPPAPHLSPSRSAYSNP